MGPGRSPGEGWCRSGGMTPQRFGAFIAPYHDPAGNPTLQLRRDLELAVLMDELGYDEVWFGEHHSGAYETIASPELMIAAAAERTRRIKLGTGVNSLSYHHPYILADRIMQLDHLTMGRAMLGMGPGQLPSDAFMMGIDPRRQRDMMIEAAEVIAPLLRGEVVSKEVDWFRVQDARLQLRPFSPDGIEMAVASTGSPTGAVLSGGFGTFLFLAHDCADWEATKRSYRLFAEHVIPACRGLNANRAASIEWVGQHSAELFGAMHQATVEAVERYKR